MNNDSSSSSEPVMASDSTIYNESNVNSTDLNVNNWASEWFGYIALCMFSLVLIIPTLGIFGLMVWEYFSEEAERKAERKKEIDQAMEQHFGGVSISERKLRKRKKRLERLQRQQQELINNNNNENDNNLDNDINIDDINENNNNNNDFSNNFDIFDDDDDDDSDLDEDDSETENLNDVDNVLKQAECLLHRRKRTITSNDASSKDLANKFDEILT